jgi:hypothetical protein
MRPEQHLQIGPIIEMVTSLVDTNGAAPAAEHGVAHPAA